LPKKGKPRKLESYFYRMKLAFWAMIIFSALGFLGDYLQINNYQIFYDFAKITLGFWIGSGISVGFSR